MRGRIPEPTALKIARGTFRADRHGGKLAPSSERPKCPSWLGKPAKKIWREALAVLEETNVAARMDRNSLARYCDAFVRWRLAAEVIERDGMTYEGKGKSGTSYIAQRPEVAIYHKLSAMLLKIEQEFGMTPAARTRINAAPREAKNENDKSRFFRPASVG